MREVHVCTMTPTLKKRILCVAANHGMIDIVTHPTRTLLYTMALAPIPDIAWVIAFVPASIAHFGRDIGIKGSLLLHMLLGTCAFVFKNTIIAETILLAYIAVIHIPAATMRLNHIQKLCMFTLIVLGYTGYTPADPDDIATPLNIRVVTMHCILGLW